MSNIKAQYLRELEKLLPYDSAQKKHCVAELENSIDEFLEDYPDTSLETLYTEFGQPKDIAAIYLNQANPVCVSQKYFIRKRIVFGVIAVLVVLTLGVSFLAFSVKDDIQDLHDGYYVDTIEEYPVETTPSLPPQTIN
ncbi:MAG: DUF6120 family protein [Faecousia sp.]